jgi:predicted nucleic acid-binding protein
LRLVLDTNTALSALIWQGVPGQLMDASVVGRVQLIRTVPLLADLIVSGDDDLLALGNFQGIAIVLAREAMRRLQEPEGQWDTP